MKSKVIKYIKEVDHDNLILNNIPKLDGEIWIKINRSAYPNLKPYYWISSCGRVYSEVSNSIIKSRHLDPDKHSSPYHKITLQTKCGKYSISKTYLIHRLMMCSFFPVDNMNELIVNHIDGDKLNIDLLNLEWTTNQGNMIHAASHNLLNPSYGENHICAKITENQAKKIIKLLLERELTHHEIAEEMHCSVSIVDSISTKKAWKHLTKDLDFSSLSYRIPKTISFNEINNICKWMENNKKESNMSIRRYCIMALNSIGIYNPTEGLINTIRYLYERKRYTMISNNYDF